MILNRLFFVVTLASFAVPILTAPVKVRRALSSEESQKECSQLASELEVLLEHESVGLPISAENKAKVNHFKDICTPEGEAKSFSSVAAAVLATHKELDTLKPKIKAAMVGPLGSIEKRIGDLMTKVHIEVGSLNAATTSFIGAESSVVFANPAGGALLSTSELAKVVNTLFSDITEMEKTVQHVSGYTVSSALQNIRVDISAMKKTLGIISPELAEGLKT